MRTIILDGEHLTLEQVLEVAEGKAKVKISPSVKKRMERSRHFIEKALRQGIIALLLVAVVAVLYSMGYLAGMSGQEALQPRSLPQPAPKLITHEGLSIADPAAFVDPARRDIVITGKIVNVLDKPKAGWFLVTEIRDAKEAVLATVTMVTGTQVYTERDRDLLMKRGMKPDQIRSMSAARDGKIPAGGSVSFEVRVVDPPAGSARFMPVLKSFDPAILEKSK